MGNSPNVINDFLRCHNSEGVPESMCIFCFHTVVAPTIEALEGIEKSHQCSLRLASDEKRAEFRRSYGL